MKTEDIRVFEYTNTNLGSYCNVCMKKAEITIEFPGSNVCQVIRLCRVCSEYLANRLCDVVGL